MTDQMCRLTLQVKTANGSKNVIMSACIRLTFIKDLYLSYTRAMGTFHSSAAADFAAEDVQKLTLYINGVQKHVGLPDEVTLRSSGTGYDISFSSRGYTLLLAQNEPYPRINSNVTLQTLIQNNLNIPEIDCEANTPNVQYIYVKENSTIWDAVWAYSIKATGNYPFIYGSNTVRVTYATNKTVDLANTVITDEGTLLNTKNLLSDVHMQDIDETYPYSAHDAQAGSYGIVRSRYYPLDNQWLYDPSVGLQARLDYSNRGVKGKFITYLGHKGEDLMDSLTNASALSGLRVNSITITADKNGLRTRLTAYDDRYGQPT